MYILPFSQAVRQETLNLLCTSSNLVRAAKQIFVENYSKADFKNTIIGCGGVLYPPDCFCDEVFNEKAFKDILPSQDDVWFWAMAVLSKRKIKTVKAYSMQIQNVEGSQKFGLCKINNKNSNGKNSFKKIAQKYPELIKIIKEKKQLKYVF